MGIRSLNSETEARVVADHRPAGTSNYDTAPVDMANFEGVRFLIPISTHLDTGTVAATFAMGATTSAFNTLLATSANMTGTTDADSRIMLVDIYRPSDQFVRGTITRATANTSIGPITAELYGASRMDVTQSTANGVIDTDYVQSPST